jgi:hypothetical protein
MQRSELTSFLRYTSMFFPVCLMPVSDSDSYHVGLLTGFKPHSTFFLPFIALTSAWISVWIIRCQYEGKTEGIGVTDIRGRRRKQLLGDLKERRGYRKLKEEALDRILCRTRFGGSYGFVVRVATEWMNEWMNEWMQLSTPVRVLSCCSSLFLFSHFIRHPSSQSW